MTLDLNDPQIIAAMKIGRKGQHDYVGNHQGGLDSDRVYDAYNLAPAIYVYSDAPAVIKAFRNVDAALAESQKKMIALLFLVRPGIYDLMDQIKKELGEDITKLIKEMTEFRFPDDLKSPKFSPLIKKAEIIEEAFRHPHVAATLVPLSERYYDMVDERLPSTHPQKRDPKLALTKAPNPKLVH